eukprot:g58.t1
MGCEESREKAVYSTGRDRQLISARRQLRGEESNFENERTPERPVFDEEAEYQLQVLFNFFDPNAAGLVHRDSILAKLPCVREEEDDEHTAYSTKRTLQLSISQFCAVMESIGHILRAKNIEHRSRKRRLLHAAAGKGMNDLQSYEEEEVSRERHLRRESQLRDFYRGMGISFSLVKVIRNLFCAIDVNRNGTLTAAEIHRINKFLLVNEYYTSS